MAEREERAEIVKLGTWMYDGQVKSEVWIVRQNFEYWYEPAYSDRPEELNEDGEAFQIIFARGGEQIALGPAKLTLTGAVSEAERLISTGISWTDIQPRKLYNGRYYSQSISPSSESEIFQGLDLSRR
jgi:hypothetical protein